MNSELLFSKQNITQLYCVDPQGMLDDTTGFDCKCKGVSSTNRLTRAHSCSTESYVQDQLLESRAVSTL